MNKSNTTIQNKSKRERLLNEHIIPNHLIEKKETKNFLQTIIELNTTKEVILFNIGRSLIRNKDNIFFKKFISEYNYPNVEIKNIPNNQFDLLGIVYQFLNTKFENLSKGSFYTQREVAYEMTYQLEFNNNQTLIDFSCGSGVFLFAADIPQDRLFGVDIDPIAVMISKFNFFIKFPNAKLYPQIYESDFLTWCIKNKEKRFTYEVGNPPYGANLDLSNICSNYIKTGESFSYFIEYGSYLLEKNGIIKYLLPEAFLNVKQHIDIRDFILDELNLARIKKHHIKFSGVMSDVYQVDITKTKTETMEFDTGTEYSILNKRLFLTLKNHIFSFFNKTDMKIIEKVKQKSFTNLKKCEFGLGVVTGDNRNKLFDTQISGSERIYTGKEISKYKFLPNKKYIIFDRKKLQQVAPDYIYRSKEKLVYKTINYDIKVVIDMSGSLTSNSANIIVPSAVDNNTIYSIAILLNSYLYSFLNKKLYGKVNKVSRENLENLPIPYFNKDELVKIETMITEFISGRIQEEKLQNFVYDYFDITDDERKYIETI